MKKVITAIPLLVMALAVIAAASVGTALSPRASVPDDAALVVGDRVVTIEALNDRIDALRALYGVTPPTGGATLAEFRRDAAKSVAVSLILDKEAAKRGIRISAKQARDTLDKYIDGQFVDGGRDQFIRELGNLGTSEPAVLDEIKRQLAVRLLMKDVVGPITISDSELTAEFAKRKSELGTPEIRAVQNIVVRDKNAAEAALNRLKEGDSMADVAADVSIDASTKDNSGVLGEVAQEQLEPSVGKAVFAVGKGGLYGPVKGEHGWNFGRVTKIVKAVPAVFADDAEAFRRLLEAEESSRHWRRWLADRIRAADVRYADAYRPEDPDAAPTTSVPDGEIDGVEPQ